MLGKLGKFLGGGVAKPIRDIAGTFIAPRDERAMNEQEYKLAVLKQFQAYTTSNKGSWFERFVGGLNALPRPLMVYGVMALIVHLCFTDSPVVIANLQQLDNSPIVAGTLSAIIAFYFGGRIQVKHLSAKEQAQRLENMERTANLIMDMNERLDARTKTPDVEDGSSK